jgi:opacity protein-like surface antigen
MRRFSSAICLFGIAALAAPAFAQTNERRFMFSVGGGPSSPVDNTSGRLNLGWNATVGAGVNLHPRVGLLAEFGFNNFGVSTQELTAIGVPDGSARIYSVTLNPIIRFNPGGRFDAYVMGGGGYYRRTLEFTEPTIALDTAFDPFYGVFFPVAVPTNTVLGSFSQNKAGINGGGGVSFRIRDDSNAQVFAEARYHHIYTTPVSTPIIPVTFGFRW